MKKRILALAFVAAMTMGLAKTAGSNDWECMNSYISCGPGEVGHMALVCGEDGDARYLQHLEWMSILCESVP